MAMLNPQSIFAIVADTAFSDARPFLKGIDKE
jgi:hypothetical protein